VSVLFAPPKKLTKRLMHKAFAPRCRAGAAARPLAGDWRLTLRTQQRTGFCWLSPDTLRQCAQRGNPGLRKRGSGASIESAHVTGYDRFSISPRGTGRMRSGPTAAAALRTNG
jgi:hypothetical protein